MAIALPVGAYYLWAARVANGPFAFGYDLQGYYDLLGRAFLSGQLHLPLDPAVKWHDMVLYQGRYYLYFGAAPAAALFVPWRLVTGHDLPQNFAVFLFAFGGFLLAGASLLRILTLANEKPGAAVRALLLPVLAFGQGMPFLVNRVAVYEVAIAGGYFFVSAVMFCLTHSIGARRESAWLWSAGVCFGLAVGSRPHLVLAGLAAVAALAFVRRRSALRLACGMAIVGLLIGVYNFARFGNPLEFGFRYQLAGPGQNRLDIGVENLLPGAYYMLLSRPEIDAVFPWMRMVFRFPFDSAERFPLPHEYFVEPSVGALWHAPLLLLVALVLLIRAPREVRGLLAGAAAGSLAVLLFLMSTHLASHRYQVDFVPLGLWTAAAAAGILCVRGWRAAAVCAVASCMVAAGLALGIAGPYHDYLRQHPRNYVRLAGWFSPIGHSRPALNPPITVRLKAAFVEHSPGFREPLVTIGHSHHNYFLYAEHAANGVRLVSQTPGSRLTYDLPDRGERAIAVLYDAGLMRVTVDGVEAIAHPPTTLVTAPSQVATGENYSDLGLTRRRFTGRLTIEQKETR